MRLRTHSIGGLLGVGITIVWGAAVARGEAWPVRAVPPGSQRPIGSMRLSWPRSPRNSWKTCPRSFFTAGRRTLWKRTEPLKQSPTRSFTSMAAKELKTWANTGTFPQPCLSDSRPERGDRSQEGRPISTDQTPRFAGPRRGNRLLRLQPCQGGHHYLSRSGGRRQPRSRMDHAGQRSGTWRSFFHAL